MADPRQLQRIYRVRTLQLGLAQTAESQARDGLASETALAARIAELAAGVAPAHATGVAASLAAAAHYRARLHQSAETAATRVRSAEHRADRAAAATREARRDQSAVEKLLTRADAEAAIRAIRALEDLPSHSGPRPSLRKVRHDPC